MGSSDTPGLCSGLNTQIILHSVLALFQEKNRQTGVQNKAAGGRDICLEQGLPRREESTITIALPILSFPTWYLLPCTQSSLNIHHQETSWTTSPEQHSMSAWRVENDWRWNWSEIQEEKKGPNESKWAKVKSRKIVTSGDKGKNANLVGQRRALKPRSWHVRS